MRGRSASSLAWGHDGVVWERMSGQKVIYGDPLLLEGAPLLSAYVHAWWGAQTVSTTRPGRSDLLPWRDQGVDRSPPFLGVPFKLGCSRVVPRVNSLR